MREPRDPLLKVLIAVFDSDTGRRMHKAGAEAPKHACHPRVYGSKASTKPFINDPSAGSPTETLLRLLLPLNDQV